MFQPWKPRELNQKHHLRWGGGPLCQWPVLQVRLPRHQRGCPGRGGQGHCPRHRRAPATQQVCPGSQVCTCRYTLRFLLFLYVCCAVLLFLWFMHLVYGFFSSRTEADTAARFFFAELSFKTVTLSESDNFTCRNVFYSDFNYQKENYYLLKGTASKWNYPLFYFIFW